MINNLLEINYTKESIEILLENYHRIKDEPKFRYILIDLNNALCSDYLTGDQRRILLVRYAFELNIAQTLKLLNLDYETYTSLLESALIVLSQECQSFNLYSDQVVAPKPFSSLLDELDYNTTNIFNLECTDMAHVLYELGDTLIYTAFGLTIDPREYTDNISKHSKYIYKTKEYGKKNATEDEFYGQDLKNNVFYGDDSLLIAELDRLGSVYY